MQAFTRLVILIFFLSFITGCAPTGDQGAKPIVVVSIPPQKYFVDYLAQDLCEVHIMIPPGSSHESYEPKPSDIQRVERSIAYFRMGPIGFELTWMKRLQSMYPSMAIFDLSRGIQLDGDHHAHHVHDGHSGCSDPHYWMAPRPVLIMVQNLKEDLISLFPESADSIDARYERLRIEIQKLDDTITQILASVENRSFAIFHPVLAYFADDYGLKQIALEQDGKEPTPARLKDIIKTMQQENVPIIFIQREFNTDHARLVAQSTGARIVVIDPLTLEWHDGLLDIANTVAGRNR